MSGAGLTLAAGLVWLIWDPTSSDLASLDKLDQGMAPAPRLNTAVQSKASDLASLTQAPIFLMTTGPMAYKEKAIQLFGLSLSPNRHAVLVSFDGASPIWMSQGEVHEDIRLTEVGLDGANFETLLGLKNVKLSDPAPKTTSASSSSASSAPMSATHPL